MSDGSAVMDSTTSTPASTSTPAPSSTTTSTSTPETTASTPAPASEPTESTPKPRPSFKKALKTFDEAERIVKAGTTPPPEATPAQATRPGAVPTDEHIKAVENGRKTGRADAERDFRSRFGDPEALAEVTAWARRAATDRQGFLRDVIAESLNDPQLAPMVRSILGSNLRSQPQPEAEPGPDFQDAHGNTFYSAKQMAKWHEWNRKQMEAGFEERIAPLQQRLDARDQGDRDYQARVQRDQWKTQTLTTVKALPFFEQHKADIAAAYAAMPPSATDNPAEEALLLRRAYDQVVGPKLESLYERQAMDKLRSQAGHSSLNPNASGASAGIPKGVRAKDGGSFRKALEWAAAQQGTGR